jgi:hypothetical protein
LIEAKCQYRGCGRKCASVQLSVLSRGQGTASSFYRPRGGGLQSCRMALSATYGGMAHSVMESMTVWANIASAGRRDESCACPEAASRVATWELLVWSPSVRRFEGWADGGPDAAQQRAWRCPVVSGSHNGRDDAAVPGMAAQRQGWPRRTALVRRHGAVLGGRGAGGRTPFKVPLSSFEGCDVEEVRECAAQCRGVDTGLPAQLPHSMAAHRGLVEQRQDMIPRRCQRAGVVGIRL